MHQRHGVWMFLNPECYYETDMRILMQTQEYKTILFFLGVKYENLIY